MRNTVYVLDSCALLSFFLGEKEQEKVKEILQKGRLPHYKIILPLLQWGEILYLVEKQGGKVLRNTIKNAIDELPLSIPDITREITEKASSYKAMGGIAYPDGFALATAVENHGVLVTKDQEFQKFEKEIEILWL